MEEQRQRVPLVLRGGGVKGLAFASALQELESFFEFTQFIGTSAGAIAAVLLGARYTPSELEKVLTETDFSKFLDANPLKAGWNLAFHDGMYRCDFVQNWIDELLFQKLEKNSVRLRDLPRHVVLFASTPGSGTVTFDSLGENRDVEAAFAVRCSMSIPILFQPQIVSGRRVYDGGLLNNFPVEYLTSSGNHDFIALYLGTARAPRQRANVLAEVLRIWLSRDEIAIVDEHRSKIVIIDPSPVRTTDFRLSEIEKQFLVEEGRADALEFLQKRQFPVDKQRVVDTRATANLRRNKTIHARNGRRGRRSVALVLACALVLTAMLLWLDSGSQDSAPSKITSDMTHSETISTVSMSDSSATDIVEAIGTTQTTVPETAGATKTIDNTHTRTGRIAENNDTATTETMNMTDPAPSDQAAKLADYTELAGVKRGDEYGDIMERYPETQEVGRVGQTLELILPNGAIAYTLPPDRRILGVRVLLKSNPPNGTDVERVRSIDPQRLWWIGRQQEDIKSQLPKECKADINYVCKANDITLKLGMERKSRTSRFCYGVVVEWWP